MHAPSYDERLQAMKRLASISMMGMRARKARARNEPANGCDAQQANLI